MGIFINYWYLFLLGVLLIIGVVVILLILRKPKRKVDVTWIVDLIGKDNITHVETVQSRVRITVRDVSLVSLDALKKQTKGIFIKDKTLVITFISNTDEIVKALRGII